MATFVSWFVRQWRQWRWWVFSKHELIFHLREHQALVQALLDEKDRHWLDPESYAHYLDLEHQIHDLTEALDSQDRALWSELQDARRRLAELDPLQHAPIAAEIESHA